MLHSIGRKQTATGDLVDMLLECHGRIRTFSAMAVMIGERVDVPADEVIEACGRVERYFKVALPLHVRDEEESILPRLRGVSAEVDAALDRMHGEHAHHQPMLERLLAACSAVKSAPDSVSARAALLTVATELRTEFEAHLRSEETILFPAIRQLDQAAIVNELRARRAS